MKDGQADPPIHAFWTIIIADIQIYKSFSEFPTKGQLQTLTQEPNE